MKRLVKLLIVDDHPIFRRGLREIIEEHPNFEVVGEASDGQLGLRLVSDRKPDIVLLDIDMPRISGLDMARALQKSEHPAQIIVLTMYKEEDMFNAAMDLGIKAYILKENAADDIVEALDRVVGGKTFISRSMSDIGKKRTDHVQKLLLSKPQIEYLTSAERRILKLIAEDNTSKEIADKLGISVKTVDNHRLNICQKLNLHGSHSLLKFAFDHKSHL
ncbi:MAG TPA: response regulator transcription factor [Verrucomicrobiae bacterium]|jgi:DNA-binding NarL/FixJ family response regulator|nr:response regulator transcription factor [Verrucomicrobiae bacterium]